MPCEQLTTRILNLKFGDASILELSQCVLRTRDIDRRRVNLSLPGRLHHRGSHHLCWVRDSIAFSLFFIWNLLRWNSERTASVNDKSITMKSEQKVLSPNILDYNFFAIYTSVKRAFSLTPMSLLRVWRRRNLWRHRVLDTNDSKRQQKRFESFIIVNNDHHNDQILNFKTNNSHWGFVHYFFAEWSQCTKIWTAVWVIVDLGLDCRAKFGEGCTCNLKTNYQILIIFGTNISDTTCHQMII